MSRFPYAHATHPQWRMAAALVLAQLRAQLVLLDQTPTLALLYITDHYADDATELLDHLRAELPEVTDWAGTVGVGIAANNVEYFDEPALAVMLAALPSDRYRVFSGIAPLPPGFRPRTALVHADGGAPELEALVRELAARTEAGYLFGGLPSSRGASPQFAVGGDGFVRGQGRASGVFHGGLSGVAFDGGVHLMSRVTQGCQPVAARRSITQAERNVVYRLDDRPALDVLLEDIGVSLDRPEQALAAVRMTLAGLRGSDRARADSAPGTARGSFGDDVQVRHIVGLDLARRGVALAAPLEEQTDLAFCRRNAEAARTDLTRICAEIREEVEAQEHGLAAHVGSVGGAEPGLAPQIQGAVYVSCAGRGGPHFGGPSAEMQIVRRALGDVPLVGFFAGGEIAHANLYGYTGVLTVFTRG